MAESVSTPIDHVCPKCGHHMTRATSIHDPQAMPAEGDISLCIACGSVGIYLADMSIRRLTGEEFRELMEESYELREVLTAWNTWQSQKESSE